MKFVDQVRIEVKAGDGGNGAIAFRREKYVERGGPSGGDGADGGSVIFKADPQLTTLLDYRYQQHHHARGGGHGLGSDMNGRKGEDMLLRVPVGTLVKDANTGELLCDLNAPDQEFVAAKGGRGGLGNMNFATSTRQAPRFAQDGTPGELRLLTLELKLLADVGLIGYPNAGKSTLISVISRARPKIADYPFTTLVPNLGMVQYKDDRSFVVADIPGLIEGASEGTGLGHQFLRHVERCRVLVHLVDLSAPGEDRSPVKDFEIINRELARYSPQLAKKPQIVVASKMDLPEAQQKLSAFEAAMARRGLKVFAISGATHEGTRALVDVMARILYGPPHAVEALHVEKPAAAKKAAMKKAAAKKPAPKKVASAKKPAKAQAAAVRLGNGKPAKATRAAVKKVVRAARKAVASTKRSAVKAIRPAAKGKGGAARAGKKGR